MSLADIAGGDIIGRCCRGDITSGDDMLCNGNVTGRDVKGGDILGGGVTPLDNNIVGLSPCNGNVDGGSCHYQTLQGETSLGV